MLGRVAVKLDARKGVNHCLVFCLLGGEHWDLALDGISVHADTLGPHEHGGELEGKRSLVVVLGSLRELVEEGALG